MPGFGSSAIQIGTSINDDVPNVLVTPSGDVISQDGVLLHSAGGGRGQGGSGVYVRPNYEDVSSSSNNSNLYLGLVALYILGVF